MNFELGHLFFAGVVYLLVLFLIAYSTEQGWISERVARHPATYALSLGVYATSWTFYGSVGFAQSQGFNFLSIYLGVTLAFVLVPVLLAPLLRLAREYQLTSLADVFAFRYRSQTAGVLVTLFMLLGAFPYIALQILAVTESISILTDEATPRVLALGFCATLTLFAILFGARHVTPREKHSGLVVAIAFESLVKLFALCAAGLFALFGVFGGVGGLDEWLARHPEALDALYRPVREGPWTTLVFLSFCAAFLLPRQFHMAFTENIEERTLFTASWAFPLFLLLLNLFIPVILWAGNELRIATSPDYYVLGITLSGGSRWLTALVFIGGLSASSAMMIVTTLALASMCLNHLLLPARYPDPKTNLYEWLLWVRRTLIFVIIIAGYFFYVVLEQNQGLVQLGLISFVAVAQFLPGVIGTLYWARATRVGVVAGLLAGGGVWAMALLLPLLERNHILHSGLHVLAIEPPHGMDPWTFATFTSLAANATLFLGVSLLGRPSHAEREAAEACRLSPLVLPTGVLLAVDSPEQFREQLARILGPEAAAVEVDQALADLGLSETERDPAELRRLRERIERNLSGLMGPMLASMIVDERLQTDPNARTALADTVRFIEERLEHSQTRLEGIAAELDSLRRYHQQILRDLPLGVCAVGADGRVVTWNRAMELVSGLGRGEVRATSVDDLPQPWAYLFRECLDSVESHLHRIQATVNGRARWLNLHKAALAGPDAAGEAQGTVILVEDQTDLRTLEAELAHSERLASIGRVAAGVAHEVGNPVTGIACLAQNLASETGEAETRVTSDRIIEQTRRISEIVETLVGFGHGGSVHRGGDESIALHECVDEAMRLVRLSRAGKQMTLENRCPGELCVAGDRTRLLQVFVNLLTNACDASRPGDTVTVRAEKSAEGVRALVEDRGAGVPPDIVGQIFEPFVTSKPPGQGTGLGLSLAYSIVQDHGGQITVDSTPGGGTRVTVELPEQPRGPALPAAATGQGSAA